MILDRLRRLGVGQSSTLTILALLLGAILLVEGRQKVLLDRLFDEHEMLSAQRQRVLAVERQLFLARSDEAEIVSAGRGSLVDRLATRLDTAVAGLDALVAEDTSATTLDDPEPLRLAVAKYRRSVGSEIDLLTRFGRLGEDGTVQALRVLESSLPGSFDHQQRDALLALQLLERDFVATLQTSKALTLLRRLDGLESIEFDAEQRRWLGEYRRLVDVAMSDALELELLRSESTLRFDRLPPMFRQLEEGLDRRLDDRLVGIAALRRDSSRTTLALLWTALLVLAVRTHSQRRKNQALQRQVARLADSMEAFSTGVEAFDRDLPRAGRLGSVAESFLDMATRIREQIDTIRSERNRAEEALQVKSDFLARVSHELRTPLHGILGMAELLLQSSRDQRQRHLVDSIARSGSTLLSVVNDLLDYSKLEAGKVVLIERPFDLVELCETELAIHATAAHAKGLELVLTVPQRLDPVLGDPLRLSQVLTNLLGNAIKFTDEGFVELIVREATAVDAVDAVDADSDTETLSVELAVRDTGPGIPNESRATIFDSFAQGEPVARRKQGGTGLGLSIVRELLTLMGGSIRVEDPSTPPSRPVGNPDGGQGVALICSLTFPRASEVGSTASVLAGQRILWVDGHAEFSGALATRLRGRGLDVLSHETASTVLGQPLPDVDAAILGQPVRGADPDLDRLCERLLAEGVPTVVLLPAEAWLAIGEGADDSPAEPLVRRPRTGALADLERLLAECLDLDGTTPPMPVSA
ncbi:MAG: ATP-binding protein, partial [Acidobacteriota bacterium]